MVPKKRVNPAIMEAQIKSRDNALTKNADVVSRLANMTIENTRIVGQLVIMFEVLKEKGIITNDEINDKFNRLRAEKDGNGSTSGVDGSQIRPESSGTDEGNLGHGG